MLTEQAAAATVQRMTKHTLVTLSHAIEHTALAPPHDEPMVVLALFQRMPYFGREMEVYRRLGRRPATVVVGLVEDYRPPMPPAVEPVLLRDGEPLSREWAVVVLTPTSGAHLTAVDLEDVAPWEASLEAGRLFDGRWGFRRDDAAAELRRYRTALADRLDPRTAAAVDRLLTLVDYTSPSIDEGRAEASLRLMSHELETARRRNVALRREIDDAAGLDRDPVTQLHTERHLRRWTLQQGVTARGVLPLGMVLVRIRNLADLRDRWGVRAADFTVRELVPALTGSLRPADRAFRLGYEDFLLVLAGGTERDADEHAHRVLAAADGVGGHYPFVPLETAVAVTVSRERPVPLKELRAALDPGVAAPGITVLGALPGH